MKIVIIEDEVGAQRQLKRLLSNVAQNHEVIAILESIEEAVQWFETHSTPDLAFFDIQLSDGLSFEIFEKITIQCPIIFTTAFDNYAIQAFKVNSIDYLLKPIKETELAKAIQKFESLTYPSTTLQDIAQLLKQPKLSHQKSRFLVKKGQQLLSIDAKKVAYIYSEDKITFIQTANGRFPINFSLDDLDKKLSSKDFFRLNRKYIANYTAIQKVYKYFNGKLLVELLPLVTEKVVVSREKASLFKNWLDD
ncbi:MAG: LytR/AlgR family response regulator transcription factor [Saprospiraceae bacterium]